VDCVQNYLMYILHSRECSELFNVHLTHKQFSELLMYVLHVDSVQNYLFYVLHSGQCSKLFNVYLTQ